MGFVPIQISGIASLLFYCCLCCCLPCCLLHALAGALLLGVPSIIMQSARRTGPGWACADGRSYALSALRRCLHCLHCALLHCAGDPAGARASCDPGRAVRTSCAGCSAHIMKECMRACMRITGLFHFFLYNRVDRAAERSAASLAAGSAIIV